MSASTTCPLRILHIEDEPDIVSLVREALEGEAAMVVESAHTLAEAREQLGSSGNGFDLVLLDLNLPDSYGVATVEALRDLPLPIVVLSALDGPETLRAAAEAGADDYILKVGASRARLIHRITFAHGRHLKRRQYEEEVAAKRALARRRMDAGAFEALKPYITCAGSRAPFGVA